MKIKDLANPALVGNLKSKAVHFIFKTIYKNEIIEFMNKRGDIE